MYRLATVLILATLVLGCEEKKPADVTPDKPAATETATAEQAPEAKPTATATASASATATPSASASAKP